MLRATVLVLGIIFAVTGAILWLVGVVVPGIQALILGALAVIGLVFERWRYHNKNASKDGDWQPTGERFVDPESGQIVQVLYDSRSGERRYTPLAEAHDKPD
jgi:hypothetical protein